MTTEQKAKAYDKALKRAMELYENSNGMILKKWLWKVFPELAEPSDERTRKALLHLVNSNKELSFGIDNYDGVKWEDIIAWLEKQGKETSWKPSKEEMDVLYGLAYITNQYDEHKEEIITRLYQDLKREFFNGSSYENMFPNTSTEDDVRRRSTIQVLEYARSLDTYNQYGKADIDKNIAWLEKQGEHANFFSKIQVGDKVTRNEGGVLVNISQLERIAKPRKAKAVDKKEPKFHEGEWITNGDYTWKIVEVKPLDYILQSQDGNIVDDTISYVDEQFHSFTVKDAKDGDVLATKDTVFIFKHIDKAGLSLCKSYCEVIGNSELGLGFDFSINNVHPATKEQRDTLFLKMKEAGYEWSEETHELKKISQRMVSAEAKEALYDKPTDEEMKELLRTEHEKGRADTIAEMEKDWSEEDERMLDEIIDFFENGTVRLQHDLSLYAFWLKSLKDRYTWKPSKGQLECLDVAIDKVDKDHSPFFTNRAYLTLKALKKQLEQL